MTIPKYIQYFDPNTLAQPQNRGRLYLILGVVGLIVGWIIYRKVVAKRPEDGAKAFDDPTDGAKNTGQGKNSPYIAGGKINVEFFPTIKEVYNFLNTDGIISATDAAHEVRFVIEKNSSDWSTNGCDYINDVCAQLGTLYNQNEEYIKQVNREYRRIYGKNIADELPSFYNVFTCKCDNNDALKAKFSKLI